MFAKQINDQLGDLLNDDHLLEGNNVVSKVMGEIFSKH